MLQALSYPAKLHSLRSRFHRQICQWISPLRQSTQRFLSRLRIWSWKWSVHRTVRNRNEKGRGKRRSRFGFLYYPILYFIYIFIWLVNWGNASKWTIKLKPMYVIKLNCLTSIEYQDSFIIKCLDETYEILFLFNRKSLPVIWWF